MRGREGGREGREGERGGGGGERRERGEGGRERERGGGCKAGRQADRQREMFEAVLSELGILPVAVGRLERPDILSPADVRIQMDRVRRLSAMIWDHL